MVQEVPGSPEKARGLLDGTKDGPKQDHGQEWYKGWSRKYQEGPEKEHGLGWYKGSGPERDHSPEW